MTITLHTFDTPNGRKISVALEEMGLPYTVKVVDIRKGEQFAPEFLALNPNNKIPALVDTDGPGGRAITVFESGAILLYLAEKTGQFWPTEPVARYQVLQWLMFQVGGFGPMPGQVHHFLSLESEAQRAYGLQRYQQETRRLYGVMNQHLAQQPWFGPELSVADFAVLGWVWRHPKHRVDLADYPSVQRWFETLMVRPAVQRGFAVPMLPA